MGTNESRKIKADITVVRLLESLKETEGKTITELADELDLAKSTIHAHVQTLVEEGYLLRRDGKVCLGLKTLDLGGAVRTRYIDELIRNKVDLLAEETGERVQFVVEELGEGVYVYCAYGENAVQTDSRIGRRFPLHFSAAGKSILAHLPAERIDEVLSNELESPTEHTINNKEELYDELEEIRTNRFAINEQESTKGLRAVGAPIQTEDHGIFGAISVSGPTHRIKGDVLHDEIPNLLLGVTNEIELKLAYP